MFALISPLVRKVKKWLPNALTKQNILQQTSHEVDDQSKK